MVRPSSPTKYSAAWKPQHQSGGVGARVWRSTGAARQAQSAAQRCVTLRPAQSVTRSAGESQNPALASWAHGSGLHCPALAASQGAYALGSASLLQVQPLRLPPPSRPEFISGGLVVGAAAAGPGAPSGVAVMLTEALPPWGLTACGGAGAGAAEQPHGA